MTLGHGDIFTARIRRMGEGNIFSLFTLVGGGEVPHLRSEVGGGVPHLRSEVGGVPHLRSEVGGYPISGLGRGYPISGLGGYPSLGGTPCLGGTQCLGVPHVRGEYPMSGGVPHLRPPIAQSSIASTCYAAGGVPLAFTQENFLVL